MKDYDVIIIGAGHAGAEAALASSRMGAKTLVITLHRATIGALSCNPAIGGVGKAQLVREIDALGGEMARAADACGIQSRILNASKGPAVQSHRVQIDKYRYQNYIRRAMEKQKNLTIYEGEVTNLLIEQDVCVGVAVKGKKFYAKAIVITAGTFLNGCIHVGMEHVAGGRINEEAAVALSENLKQLGLTILRFKTGTCARIDRRTIDFSSFIVQPPDVACEAFSFFSKKRRLRQVPCHITYTNARNHEIIRRNLDRSPLYTGIIKATGVRYCPSIEDKVVKFSERERHQIFLEPEGLDTPEVYMNGFSTSLPQDVQDEMIHSMQGLEQAKIIRYGYGIEHDVIEPTQLTPSLETKLIKNLFIAGQLNGTTGYEEAAAQGIVAGINAVLKATQREPLIFDRATSYIGVLIDDLVTKGTNEPYRMFTSRVEYRLILREDNADLRLSSCGCSIGLLAKKDYAIVAKKEAQIKKCHVCLAASAKPSTQLNAILQALGTAALERAVRFEDLLKRPQIGIADLEKLIPGLKKISTAAKKQVEIDVKYAGFIERQKSEVERFRNLEKIKLPSELDYSVIPSLSREIKEKLDRFRPVSLGQASRISGVTPASISILMVYLKNAKGLRD